MCPLAPFRKEAAFPERSGVGEANGYDWDGKNGGGVVPGTAGPTSDTVGPSPAEGEDS